MDTLQKIVVVSGANPAKLHTKLHPVKINENVGLAVTSFSHGEISNIDERNNKIFVRMNRGDNLQDISAADNYFAVKEVQVPVGRYVTTLQLLKQMKRTITSYYSNLDNFNLPDVGVRGRLSKLINIDYSIEQNLMKIKSSGNLISISIQHCTIFMSKQSPWNQIGVTEDLTGKIEFKLENNTISHDLHNETAFLYVNIARDSYINGNLSRNLAMLPLYNNAGGSYYEFKNPIYIPIEIKQFSDIVLEIRNIHGDYVPFNKEVKTVISLHLKRL